MRSHHRGQGEVCTKSASKRSRSMCYFVYDGWLRNNTGIVEGGCAFLQLFACEAFPLSLFFPCYPTTTTLLQLSLHLHTTELTPTSFAGRSGFKGGVNTQT